jgi:RHS repeat-associated protein
LSGTSATNILSGGIDEFFNRTDSSGSFTPLQDALGSTIALVDGSGVVTTSYSYDPFGNTTVSGAASSNPSQYTGRENEGNGLYFYRARYYSPLLGRFVGEDPLGFDGGDVNLYAYVFDNPINYQDPTGTTCYYSQSTGVLTCYPSSSPLHTPNSCSASSRLAGRKDHQKPYYQAKGYSGTGTGRNNPFAQDVSNVGPLPRGPWRMTGRWHNKIPHPGKNVMDIYPLPGNDCARTGRNCDTFRIHGNNAQNDASQGCIIMPPNRTNIPPGETLYVTE